jgi:hypothetical protein
MAYFFLSQSSKNTLASQSLFKCCKYYWWRRPEYHEKTTDLPLDAINFDHIMLHQVHLPMSGIRTHNFNGDPLPTFFKNIYKKIKKIIFISTFYSYAHIKVFNSTFYSCPHQCIYQHILLICPHQSIYQHIQHNFRLIIKGV